MHYPHRISIRKRLRKQGFRARMRTPGGRKMMARKRHRGRRINVQ
ncbi:MAG: 50S ribosomal protein L34 [Phycisphaerae bacterium]|nr:50S ribosomal protein L34 [Phycisphaerae bacterium]